MLNNILEREAKLKKISASYLLYSDNRIDLLFKAKLFVEYIMKYNKDEMDMNDVFNHPDVIIINKDNKVIKVDDIKNIISEAIVSKFSNSKKIFIINGVEKMNKESINALLKIIEEPPIDVYFILLSKTLNILDTIKSRTIKIYIPANIDNINIKKDIYYMLNGNEKYIKEYIENKVDDISMYYINDINSTLKYISDYYEEPNMINRIKYYIAIEYIVDNIKYINSKEYIIYLKSIENIMNSDKDKTRDNLFEFLHEILIISINKKNIKNMDELIEIKNSIRNNININLVLILFFEKLVKE